MQNRIGLALTHWWMSWRLLTAWLSTLTCTARGDKLRTRTIGTNVQAANSIVPHLMKNGRRWLRVYFPPLTKQRSVPTESQFPTATRTLELLFRLRLGCCASTVRALHRANLSHNVNFSRLQTSFQD